ncbi:MAG: riboflavin synthase [Gammaproteobacteria bacterium]|nr:riboflavin synthase [Gammaproteobacteria bacterium]|tara:strand:- start:1176 stop:1787 length:612 start_codon:yes stop_codon:yes gene_type:complete
MFTGIVQGVGVVTQVADRKGIRRLQIRMPEGNDQELATGASIAINGLCLTVVGWDDQGIQFDVIDESLRLSNLSSLRVGSLVNVERAARFGDEIGGHVLSGHIHGLAKVINVVQAEENLAFWVSIPAALSKYVLPKGYVSLNGCSLTVGELVKDGQFSIHLIPETRAQTTFEQVTSGDQLNLEIDSQTQAIVDTVERVLDQRL